MLRYAIQSVLWQTRADWELIVVGDACTDDTAEVVASFGDRRIQFLNLEHNVGEQSGPNNAGLRRARGRYVAYPRRAASRDYRGSDARLAVVSVTDERQQGGCALA